MQAGKVAGGGTPEQHPSAGTLGPHRAPSPLLHLIGVLLVSCRRHPALCSFRAIKIAGAAAGSPRLLLSAAVPIHSCLIDRPYVQRASAGRQDRSGRCAACRPHPSPTPHHRQFHSTETQLSLSPGALALLRTCAASHPTRPLDTPQQHLTRWETVPAGRLAQLAPQTLLAAAVTPSRRLRWQRQQRASAPSPQSSGRRYTRILLCTTCITNVLTTQG